MICPKCGNNDVRDPEICPKCGSVLKVNDQKIGSKDSWKKNDYYIRKDKDVILIRSTIAIICLIIVIGGVIFIGAKFDAFSNDKSVKMPDALKYINNINKYIAEANKEKNSYKVNGIEYAYYSIPTSNYCSYVDGKWNDRECESYMTDLDNYCKSLTNGCIMPPSEIHIWFENNKVKNGSTLKFDDVECTYNVVNEKDDYDIKNMKCIQPKIKKS